jgi:hypothetical protein
LFLGPNTSLSCGFISILVEALSLSLSPVLCFHLGCARALVVFLPEVSSVVDSTTRKSASTATS